MARRQGHAHRCTRHASDVGVGKPACNTCLRGCVNRQAQIWFNLECKTIVTLEVLGTGAASLLQRPYLFRVVLPEICGKLGTTGGQCFGNLL